MTAVTRAFGMARLNWKVSMEHISWSIKLFKGFHQLDPVTIGPSGGITRNPAV